MRDMIRSRSRTLGRLACAASVALLLSTVANAAPPRPKPLALRTNPYAATLLQGQVQTAQPVRGKAPLGRPTIQDWKLKLQPHPSPGAAASAALIGFTGPGGKPRVSAAGDTVRFYEINPEVQTLAAARFSYLGKCLGQVEIVPGDARLSLEREPPQHFDLLVLDAFSSDAIPMHLLTREAFEIYGRHLNPGGLIAVHISNHYLDLEPVVLNLARYFSYRQAVIDYEENEEEWWLYSSTWVLLTRSEQIINSPAIRHAVSTAQTNSLKVPLWTDDFASLFPIIRGQ